MFNQILVFMSYTPFGRKHTRQSHEAMDLYNKTHLNGLSYV